MQETSPLSYKKKKNFQGFQLSRELVNKGIGCFVFSPLVLEVEHRSLDKSLPTNKKFYFVKVLLFMEIIEMEKGSYIYYFLEGKKVTVYYLKLVKFVCRSPECMNSSSSLLLFMLFCIPQVTENRSFFSYYLNCTLLRQYL